jgi:hypothetical protein
MAAGTGKKPVVNDLRVIFKRINGESVIILHAHPFYWLQTL